MQNDDLESTDPTPTLASPAVEVAVSSPIPLTDVSPGALIDVVTPLENQEDVQHTLDTEQRRAAVYGPVLDSTPEQTPDQNAAVSGSSSNSAQSKSTGVLSKPAKRDKKQLASSNSGGELALQEEQSARLKFDGKFTFTAAPHVPMSEPPDDEAPVVHFNCAPKPRGAVAKKAQRKNFSHSEARLIEIKRENKMMVDRLAHVGTSQPHTPLPPAPAASAGVNRRKAADNINEENYAMFRRLQPSKEMRREQLELEFKANQQYVQNASHYRSAASSRVDST